MTRFALVGLLALSLLGSARAQNPLAKQPSWLGTFATEDGSVTLVLERSGGDYTGTLSVGGTSYPVSASRSGAGLQGTFGEHGYPLQLSLRGDVLSMTSEGNAYTLRRVSPQAPPNPLAGTPTAGARPAGPSANWKHREGFFSLQLPQSWRVNTHGRDVFLLDPGKQGGVLYAVCGELDDEEVGVPLQTLLERETLTDIDALLWESFRIRARSAGTTIQPQRVDGMQAAKAQWAGALHTPDERQEPVAVWTGFAIKDTFFVALIATITKGKEAQFLQDVESVFASIRVLKVPPRGTFADEAHEADPLASAAQSKQSYQRKVTVNRKQIDDATLKLLEQGMSLQIPDGSYWYDPTSGAVGVEGGPASGFFPGGLNLGGPLRADASGGGTAVFVNGRELHPYDVTALQGILGAVRRGRYWLDSYGNYGIEGQRALGNLLVVARNSGSRGGAGGAGGGGGAWTRYKDYGGAGGKTNFGSFGNGDYFFSSGGVSWWPGK